MNMKLRLARVAKNLSQQELADEVARAERARQRFESRNARIEQEEMRRAEELRAQKDAALRAGRKAIDDIVRRKKGKSPDEDGD